MGGGSWSFETFTTTTSATASKAKSVHEAFKARTMHEHVDPTKIVVRESRDSAEHPESNAVALFFDVTGSMGSIPFHFAKGALGVLMEDLLKKQPVPHPQLLVGAVGDSTCDRYPLQVGQFESDNRIDEWLTKVVIEGGGGGGNHESYGLPYLFAGTKTSIDCFEKRGRKGFLFTVGDEAPHLSMAASEIQRVFGDPEAKGATLEEAIASARKMYDVVHILVKSDSYDPAQNIDVWRRYLGQDVLVLEDYKALAELVVATIAVRAGMSVAAATAGFGRAATELVLRSGVTNLPATVHGVGTGIATL